MGRVTVIGYGNPLRGDDGLGFLIAQRLAEHVVGLAYRTSNADLPAEPTCPTSSAERVTAGDIEVLALYQLTPELADEISRSDLVVFVDACCNEPPGRISCRAIAPHSSLPGPTTHYLDPSGLLAFTEKLYGSLPGKAILLTVGGESFDYVEGLSPTVTAAVPILERIVHSYIK